MSYARKNEDSDIYIVHSSDMYRCYACPLYDEYQHVEVESIEELLNHVLDHVDAGHKVSSKTLTRITLEWENST